ncbi:MAG TPA: hypothetical protein VIT38_02090 [Allosphingosinicella sp.]
MLATLWLAFVTSLLAFFTYRLWSATTKLATEAKISGETQADKMERSIAEAAKAASAMAKMADAADTQIRHSQDTAERQLRAYAGIESQGMEPYEWGSAETGKVMFNIKNYGQTPAFQCVTKISLAVAPYDRDSPIIPDKWDREVERPPRDIPPEGNLLREVNLPAEEIVARWQDITDGTDAVFVRIEITYSSFGRRYRQTTVMHVAGKRYGEGKLNTTRQSAEEQLTGG